jgi:hypothetical protein
MPKSRIRKKKGKPVKYTPKPTGISKTKMKKLMELLEQYKENSENTGDQIPEIREGAGSLIIPEEFKKKMNILPEDESPNSGPELSEKNTDETESNSQESAEDNKENDESESEGPSLSDI